MYTLDANIFVRDADPRDAAHRVCSELLDVVRTTNVPIILPTLALVEVAGAVGRSHRDPMRGRLAAALIRAIPTLTLLPLDALMAQEAADIAADYGMRGADAVYVAVARHRAATLVSLDREIRDRVATLITVLTPAEALAELQQRGDM